MFSQQWVFTVSVCGPRIKAKCEGLILQLKTVNMDGLLNRLKM
jgi:hypothetical protein